VGGGQSLQGGPRSGHGVGMNASIADVGDIERAKK
jgi:hypothetical protein